MPIAQRFFGVETVKCPTMGDSISEGTVAEFVITPGEYVEEDEIVAVVETDKVMVDIRSPHSGVLGEYFTEEGETILVDGEFFTIDTDAEAPAGGAAPAATEESTPEPVAQTAATPEAPKAAAPKAAAPKKAAPKSDSPPPIKGSRQETRVPMSRMRKRIADRLKEAQNTAAMLTTFNEVDLTNLMALRKQY